MALGDVELILAIENEFGVPIPMDDVVRFELHEEGGSVKIVFDQAGFPEEAGPHLEGGWTKMYWEPLKAYLE